MSRSIQVARHEAAHAIVALSLGFGVGAIEMRSRGDTDSGATLVRFKGPYRRDPLAIALVYLAGHAADIRWHRQPVTHVSYDDALEVRRMGFRGKSCATLLMHARALVDESAPLIDALAREVKRADMTGRQIRAFVEAFRSCQ